MSTELKDTNGTIAKPTLDSTPQSTDESIEKIQQSITSTKLTSDQLKKLKSLIDSIPEILQKLDNPEYDEIFGYRINTNEKPHVDYSIRNEILLKFLIADKYDLTLTKERIINCLNWRNEFQPLNAAFEEKFDIELNELGLITDFKTTTKSNLKIITWNLYGNVRNPKRIFEKFGDNNNRNLPGSQFLRWRIGLMEKSLQLIEFTDPTNNKIGQIHDYNNVSMFKIDPNMKKSTKEIIEIFSSNYPELLSTKFFINVPLIMGWVFTFFKTIRVINEDTLKKFQVLNNGDLTSYLPKSDLPKSYGGDLKDKTIFNLDISDNIKLSEYGEIILKNVGDYEIQHNNDDVE
ncbi:SFH5 [Candida pseudojiufengensis]|uniref:SFH5 n=1 Tax=Candida pseudojiufengensis TaxID=497109 RepID=UPI002225A692|nr:SFH5 [Candida pseudojiufengensis]KAI5963751.1 SFH5 [Candida pseudojiufengensis]